MLKIDSFFSADFRFLIPSNPDEYIAQEFHLFCTMKDYFDTNFSLSFSKITVRITNETLYFNVCISINPQLEVQY